MKVTILVGGRWHAIELARELHKVGLLHRLITNYPKFKTRQWGVPDYKVVSLPLTLALNKAIAKIAGDSVLRQSLPFLYQLFARDAVRHLEGSTLIHGWSSFCGPSLKWAKENGVPLILERSSAHIKAQYELLTQEYQQLGLVCKEIPAKLIDIELEEYSLADKVAVPSFFAKRTFLEQGFPEERLIHNPFGTNLKTFSPGVKQDQVFRVVYAGSLSIRKGIHYLVRAFMQANIPNSELCLIGGATPETPLLLKGSDERVKCTGHIPEPKLAEYYRNSSVFVMPSIEDGFGYVLAQALACGLPLVCTKNTGGEDLLRIRGAEPIKQELNIEEYPAGYLVPPRNSEAIASLLKLLASNPDVLEQKRQEALSFQEKDLSWEQYTQRTLKEYQKVFT